MATVVDLRYDRNAVTDWGAAVQGLSGLSAVLQNIIAQRENRMQIDQAAKGVAAATTPQEAISAMMKGIDNPNMIPQVVSAADNLFKNNVKIIKHKLYVTNPDGSKSPVEFNAPADQALGDVVKDAQGFFGNAGQVTPAGPSKFDEATFETDQGKLPLKDYKKLTEVEIAKERLRLQQQNVQSEIAHRGAMEGIARERVAKSGEGGGTGKPLKLTDAGRAAMAEAATALYGGDQAKVTEKDLNEFIAIRQRRQDAFAMGTKSTGMAGMISEPTDATGLKTVIENMHPNDPMLPAAKKRLEALSGGTSATPTEKGKKKTFRLPDGRTVTGHFEGDKFFEDK